MAGKNTGIFGIHKHRQNLDNALQALIGQGFRNEDVPVLVPEDMGNKELATIKATKAPKGTATGLAPGAVVGGTLGWLAGIGGLAIPGVGPLVAAGPIVAALAGVGAGSVVGGMTAP